jgi:hypothetical protein
LLSGYRGISSNQPEISTRTKRAPAGVRKEEAPPPIQSTQPVMVRAWRKRVGIERKKPHPARSSLGSPSQKIQRLRGRPRAPSVPEVHRAHGQNTDREEGSGMAGRKSFPFLAHPITWPRLPRRCLFSPSTEVRQPLFRYRMSPCHLERHEPPEVPHHHPAPVKEFWIASRRSPRVEHHCRGTFIINGLPGCPGRSPRPGLPRILARGGAASGGWPTVPYGVLVTSTPMLLGSEDLGGRVLGRAAKEAQ